MKKTKMLLGLLIFIASIIVSSNVFATTKITSNDLTDSFTLGDSKLNYLCIEKTKTAKVTSGKIKVGDDIKNAYYQIVNLSKADFETVDKNLSTLNKCYNNYSSSDTEENRNAYLKASENYIKSLPDFEDNKWTETDGNLNGAIVNLASDNNVYFVLWLKGLTNDNKTVYSAILYKTINAITSTTDNSSSNTTNNTESTDFSNVKISFKNTGAKSFVNYSLKFENVTFKDKEYFVYLSHNKTKPEIKNDATGKPSNADGTIISATGKNNAIYSDEKLHKVLEEYGDIYVSVVEYDAKTKKEEMVLTSKKVTRPSLNSLGQRLKIYMFADETSFFVYDNKYDGIERNVKLKVGKVTDNSILKSIKNGDADCLNKLNEYAKKDNGIYSKTFKISKNTNNLGAFTQDMKLKNKEYYYVYTYLEDENNKYVGIEDISLCQALSTSKGYTLIDYLSDQFKWNISDNKSNNAKDNTTANKIIPFTGTSITLIMSVIFLLAVTITCYIKNKKYKDIK